MENEKIVLEFLDKNYANYPQLRAAYEQLKENFFDFLQDRMTPVYSALRINTKDAKLVKYSDGNSVWYGFKDIKHKLMWDLECGVVYEDGKIVPKVYVDIRREGVDYKKIIAKIEAALPQDIIDMSDISAGHLLYIRYRENTSQCPIAELAARLDKLCGLVQKALQAAFK